MKKNFLYLSVAVMTAMASMCMMACGDDDDEVAKPNPVTLTLPTNAEHAVQYKLASAMPATSTTGDEVQDAPELTSINFTESGKLLLELRNPKDGKLSYIMEDATFRNNVYSVNSRRVSGTIGLVKNSARTRATDGLVINITVTYTVEETIAYTTGDETVTVTTTTTITGDEAMDRLARTWKILGVILDLKSDTKNIKAYEEFNSRGGMFYLEDVLKEALDQGISLSDNDKEKFKRIVESVTFTKTGIFTIDYNDGGEDVASWTWSNADKTAFKILLKDEDMGNKFIADNTNISVAFSDTRCNMKLETTVKDNSNTEWIVAMTLKLQQ